MLLFLKIVFSIKNISKAEIGGPKFFPHTKAASTTRKYDVFLSNRNTSDQHQKQEMLLRVQKTGSLWNNYLLQWHERNNNELHECCSLQEVNEHVWSVSTCTRNRYLSITFTLFPWLFKNQCNFYWCLQDIQSTSLSMFYQIQAVHKTSATTEVDWNILSLKSQTRAQNSVGCHHNCMGKIVQNIKWQSSIEICWKLWKKCGRQNFVTQTNQLTAWWLHYVCLKLLFFYIYFFIFLKYYNKH